MNNNKNIQIELYKNSKVCTVNLEIIGVKLQAHLNDVSTSTEEKKIIERDLKRIPQIQKQIQDLEIMSFTPTLKS
jgi:hypothetical protein